MKKTLTAGLVAIVMALSGDADAGHNRQQSWTQFNQNFFYSYSPNNPSRLMTPIKPIPIPSFQISTPLPIKQQRVVFYQTTDSLYDIAQENWPSALSVISPNGCFTTYTRQEPCLNQECKGHKDFNLLNGPTKDNPIVGIRYHYSVFSKTCP